MYKRTLTAILLVVSATMTPGVAGSVGESPTASAGLDRTVRVGETVYLDAGGSVDPDGEIVSYDWTVTAPDGRTVTKHGPRARWEPTTTGRYVVTLRVTDDDGQTARDTAYVDARPSGGPSTPNGTEPDAGTPPPGGTEPGGNERPTGEIGGPTTVEQGETAQFDARVYDPDGHVVSYDWTLDGGGRTVTRRFTEPPGATVRITLTVTDDDGATREFSTTVTVVGGEHNEPPTARIEGPTYTTVGQQVTFTLHGGDPDGAIIRRQWTTPRETDGASVVTTFDEPGNHTVRAAVTDDDGVRSWATHTIRVVESTDRPPLASLSGPDVVMDGDSAVYELDATDPDGGPLTVEWLSHPSGGRQELAPGGSGGETTGHSTRLTISGEPGEVVTVRARITDDEGNSQIVSTNTRVSNGSTTRLDAATRLVVTDFDKQFIPDRATQTDEEDVIRPKYRLNVSFEYNRTGPVTVVWTFGNEVRNSQTKVVERGTTTVTTTHVFVSESGGQIPKTVSITVTDQAGNTDTLVVSPSVKTMNDGGRLRMRVRADGQHAEAGGAVSMPVGETATFAVTSAQPSRLETGDGENYTLPGGATSEVSHGYSSSGERTVVATSIQGANGIRAARVRIDVERTRYTEYRYTRVVRQTERTVAVNSPPGEGWERTEIVETQRRTTDDRQRVKRGTRRQLPGATDPTVTWVRAGTTTETITETDRQVTPQRPGPGWTRVERRVERQTTTRTETRTTWRDSRYSFGVWELVGSRTTRTAKYTTSVGRPGAGWSRVGDTGRNRLTGHRYTWRSTSAGGSYTGRRDCTQYARLFGDRECLSYRYQHRVPVYDDVYRWRGWEYDTDYQYQRTVQTTVTVWAHRWQHTSQRTVVYDVYRKRETVTRWAWTRSELTEGAVTWSLTEPASKQYVNGTLSVYQRQCDGGDGHFDDRMCG